MFEIKIEGFEDILFMINFSAQNSLKTVIAEKNVTWVQKGSKKLSYIY